MSSSISIVVPLFNEEKRIVLLHEGMIEFHRYCELPAESIEWILVDDGSVDKTWELLQELAQTVQKDPALVQAGVRVVCKRLPKNSGKGAALQAGVLASEGQWVLTMDADMATDPRTLDVWLREGRWDPADQDTLCIGSRVHRGSTVDDGLLRRIMGRTFNLVTRAVCGMLTVGDSQCGFKLYPGQSGRELFRDLKCMGWAHDVELLLRAQEAGLAIRENPVDWRAVDDSRVNPLSDAFGMFFQVLLIRLRLKGQRLGRLVRDPWALAFVLMLLAAVGFTFSTYSHHGIPIDDPIQQLYGEYSAKWYLSGFEDERALTLRNLRFYGAAFEVWPGLLKEYYPGLSMYPLRRLLGALVGLLGVVGAWRLTWLVTGKSRAAFIAAALLLANPFFVGHHFINTKDGPLAVAYIWCLFYLARLIQGLPSWSTRRAVHLGLALGLALGIRVGAAILVPTIMLGVGLALLQHRRNGVLAWKDIGLRFMGIGATVATVTYATMVAFWPAAQVHPILQPWQALTKSMNFGWNGQVRFFGELPRAMELPRYYDPLLLLLQTPEVLLLGLLFAAIFVGRLLRNASQSRRLQYLVLAVASFFPILTVMVGGAILFDKARHLLFVVGPLAVLAAAGWEVVLSWSPRRVYIAGGAMAALLTLPIVRMVHLHPYEYTYFNELAGGPRQGFEDFGADYWFLSGWEALSGLDAYLAAHDNEDQPVAVFCTGFPHLVKAFAATHPRVRLTLNKGNADYFALSSRVDIDKAHTGEIVARTQRYDFDFFLIKKAVDSSPKGKPKGQ